MDGGGCVLSRLLKVSNMLLLNFSDTCEPEPKSRTLHKFDIRMGFGRVATPPPWPKTSLFVYLAQALGPIESLVRGARNVARLEMACAPTPVCIAPANTIQINALAWAGP